MAFGLFSFLLVLYEQLNNAKEIDFPCLTMYNKQVMKNIVCGSERIGVTKDEYSILLLHRIIDREGIVLGSYDWDSVVNLIGHLPNLGSIDESTELKEYTVKVMNNPDPNYNADANIEYAANPDVFDVVGLSDWGACVQFQINDYQKLEITADQADTFAKQLIAAAKVARKLDKKADY